MNPQGLRMAAVRLAAIHPDDRQWLLAQLMPQQAVALRELLQDPELRQFATRLGTSLAAMPEAHAAMSTEPVEPLPAQVKALAPAWMALWLSVHASGDMEHRLHDMEPWRARRVLDEAGRFAQPLPPALAEALAQWGQAS